MRAYSQVRTKSGIERANCCEQHDSKNKTSMAWARPVSDSPYPSGPHHHPAEWDPDSNSRTQPDPPKSHASKQRLRPRTGTAPTPLRTPPPRKRAVSPGARAGGSRTAAPAMAWAESPPRGRPPSPLPFLLVLLVASAALPRGARAVELGLKVPFSPRDVLPILPRQVAWPVMNTLHNAVDLLPSFVAAVAPGAPAPAAWGGACFAENEAAIELTPGDRNGTDVGGAVLRLKVPLHAS